MKTRLSGVKFETISIDIACPFPNTNNGFVYILVIADNFTKCVELDYDHITNHDENRDCLSGRCDGNRVKYNYFSLSDNEDPNNLDLSEITTDNLSEVPNHFNNRDVKIIEL